MSVSVSALETNDDDGCTSAPINELLTVVDGGDRLADDTCEMSSDGSPISQSKEPSKKSMLSMLAEVASATLHNADGTEHTVLPEEMSEKTVEELQSLKPSTLIELFTVFSSDELKKKYSFACKMLPDKCNAVISSFGNELRSKQQMVVHLKEHLEQLKQMQDAGGIILGIVEDKVDRILGVTEAVIPSDEQTVTFAVQDSNDVESSLSRQDSRTSRDDFKETEYNELNQNEYQIEAQDFQANEMLNAAGKKIEAVLQNHSPHNIASHSENITYTDQLHQQSMEQDIADISVEQSSIRETNVIGLTAENFVDQSARDLQRQYHVGATESEFTDHSSATGSHRKRRDSVESTATASASEQEDTVQPGEAITDENGEVYFRPGRVMDPCESGAQDWTRINQLLDHNYTHPCGPPEIPTQRLPTLSVHISAEGGNNLSDDALRRKTPQTIPTAMWPSIYTPLLPNISQIEEIPLPPKPRLKSKTPAFTPQIISVMPPSLQHQQQKSVRTVQVVRDSQGVEYMIENNPLVIKASETKDSISSTFIHAAPTTATQSAVISSSRPIVSGICAPTSRRRQKPDEHSQITAPPPSAVNDAKLFGRNRLMFEDENGALYEYEDGLVEVPLDDTGRGTTMQIVVDPETGQEYAVEYPTSELLAETPTLQAAPSSTPQQQRQHQPYSIQLVTGADGEESAVVVYEDGQLHSQQIGWTEEEVTDQEVSTNFSPFESRLVYATPQQGGRSNRIAIDRMHEEELHAVTMLDQPPCNANAVAEEPAFKVHNGRVIPTWERQMALNCLKALNERSEPDFVLQCKICNNNKTFTAAATLISHYRSHAGIKPFTCHACGATFTRQHSLKYHMLIHNNASRFTCLECGRQFRHPSHFKEHLRRHTGETPFECVDCEQRFKTRNTYKRHLKTRHNKLLSKEGIAHLVGGVGLEYATDDVADDDSGMEPGEVCDSGVIGEADEMVSEMVVIEEGYDEHDMAG